MSLRNVNMFMYGCLYVKDCYPYRNVMKVNVVMKNAASCLHVATHIYTHCYR